MNLRKLSVDASKTACRKLQVQDGNKTKYQELSLVDLTSLDASRVYVMVVFIIMPVI